LLSYVLVDDLASLLQADDLSNVNDQRKTCCLLRIEQMMNEMSLSEKRNETTMASRGTVFRDENFPTHSW
jgi:hypothetical protein